MLLTSFFVVPMAGNCAGIPFFTASIEEGKAMAVQEDKLLFVHFTASWCMPCQWLEHNTFQDYNLTRYVRQNVVSIQLDVDDYQGFQEKEAYQITQLPSFLIFNSSGQLLERVEKTLSANELLTLLRKYQGAGYHASAGVPSSGFDHLNKPSLSPARKMPTATASGAEKYTASLGNTPPPSESIQDYQPPRLQASPAKTPAQGSPASSNSRTNEPAGDTYYGVQVAIFSSYNNAVPFVTRLEGRISERVDIFVNDEDYYKPIYKVVVGKYLDQNQAKTESQKLEQQGYRCQVLDLSKL